MALFTDGTIATLEDLATHEHSVLDVASNEGIDLTAKLRLAQDEIGVELTGSSLRLMPYGHGELSLNNVAVTTPLKLWHAFHTLELTYRDAYGSQLNERYQDKWDQYRNLSAWAAETLLHAGLGLVWSPLPAASAPELSYVAGSWGASTYFARVSWLNHSGEEGMPGRMAVIDTPSGNVVAVKATNPPANAAGWNVFVGTAVDALSRQNQNPLEIGGTWIAPGTGLVAGPLPGTGQEPNCLRRLPRVLPRG